MALGATEKDRGLNVNTRPASVDLLAGQRTIFPMEAFVFDDPNRTDNPALRMKEPWKFISNGMEVYEEGVDPDNLQDGDRRLIVEGEVLKLQHYEDPPGEWVDDISLGGYDAEGNFKPYVFSKGLVHPDLDINNLIGGFGVLPFEATDPHSDTKQDIEFANLNGLSSVIGETYLNDSLYLEEGSTTWNGKPLYRSTGSVIQGLYNDLEWDNSGAVSYLNRLVGSSGYFNFSGAGMHARISVVDGSITTLLGTARHHLQISNVYTSVSGIDVYMTVNLYVRNNNLEADVIYRLSDYTSVTVTFMTEPIIDGTIHNFNFLFVPSFKINEVGGLIQVTHRMQGRGLVDGGYKLWSVQQIDSTGIAANTQYSDYYCELLNNLRLPLSQNVEMTDLCVQGALQNSIDFTDDAGIEYLDQITQCIPWAEGTRYWGLFDSEEDIIITPKSAGDTVIVGAQIIDDSGSLILTGPSGANGAKGDTGDTGEQGPQGDNGFSADAWDAGTTYSEGELVIEDNELWISQADTNLNNTPSTDDGTYWESLNKYETYPIGGLMPFPATSIPTGWLSADGTIVNIVDYPDLFDVIGTTYGGDGTTTFGLPDMSGIGVTGVGTQVGASGQTWGDADAVGTVREDQMQQITGSFRGARSGAGTKLIVDFTGSFSDGGDFETGNAEASGSTGDDNQQVDFDSADSPDARTGTYTRGPGLIVTWCIKARITSAGDASDANVDQRLSDLEAGTGVAFMKGHFYGLETSLGVDTANDITIAVGECRDYTGNHNLILTSAITKQIDATWVAGDDAGGMFTGTVAVATTYHLFLIRKDSDGSIDAGFDTDVDCANIPSGYIAYRRVGSVVTDDTLATIRPFRQNGDRFFDVDGFEVDNTGSAYSTTAALKTLSNVPLDISPVAWMRPTVSSTNNHNVRWWHPDLGVLTATTSACQLIARGLGDTHTSTVVFEVDVDESSQIYEVAGNTNSLDNRWLVVQGWTDDRGKLGGK